MFLLHIMSLQCSYHPPNVLTSYFVPIFVATLLLFNTASIFRRVSFLELGHFDKQ